MLFSSVFLLLLLLNISVKKKNSKTKHKKIRINATKNVVPPARRVCKEQKKANRATKKYKTRKICCLEMRNLFAIFSLFHQVLNNQPKKNKHKRLKCMTTFVFFFASLVVNQAEKSRIFLFAL